MRRQIDPTIQQERAAGLREVGRQPVRQVFHYYIETDDPRYAPPTVADIESVVERYTKEPGSGTVPRRTLYVVGELDIPVRVTCADITSLVLSTSIGSCLLIMGFIAPITTVLPVPAFWWTIAFPVLGIACADLLLVRRKLMRRGPE
jgi:hypothetical protein